RCATQCKSFAIRGTKKVPGFIQKSKSNDYGLYLPTNRSHSVLSHRELEEVVRKIETIAKEDRLKTYLLTIARAKYDKYFEHKMFNKLLLKTMNSDVPGIAVVRGWVVISEGFSRGFQDVITKW